jgi:hypothetical protein
MVQESPVFFFFFQKWLGNLAYFHHFKELQISFVLENFKSLSSKINTAFLRTKVNYKITQEAQRENFGVRHSSEIKIKKCTLKASIKEHREWS